MLYLGEIHPFGSLVKWHPATVDRCAAMLPWTCEHGSAVASLEQASAAVVLIVETEQGERFGGFRTTVFRQHLTSNHAEHSAVTLALLWTLQLLDSMTGWTGFLLTSWLSS